MRKEDGFSRDDEEKKERQWVPVEDDEVVEPGFAFVEVDQRAELVQVLGRLGEHRLCYAAAQRESLEHLPAHHRLRLQHRDRADLCTRG